MSSAALSSLSDALFSVSIAVYSLAFVGFCAELAFNRGRRSTALVEPDGSAVRQGPVVRRSAAGRPDGDDSSPRWRKRASGRPALLGRVGVALTLLAATAQAGVPITRGMATGRLPWGNVYELGTAVVLVAVIAFLVTVHRVPEARRLGIFVVGPAALALVLIGLFLYTQAGPLVAALRSAWLAVHVTAAVVGFGTFMVSGIANVLYLVRLRRDAVLGGDTRLPSAATLDVVGHRTAVFGFPIWTFAVIAGAIWAESAWGRFWGWDPKETRAFIAWVIYAA